MAPDTASLRLRSQVERLSHDKDTETNQRPLARGGVLPSKQVPGGCGPPATPRFAGGPGPMRPGPVRPGSCRLSWSKRAQGVQLGLRPERPLA